MKRVLVITNNLQQASFRLLVGTLIDPLAQRGIELDVQVRPKNVFARRRLLKSASDYDSVLLHRKLLDPWDAKLLRRHAKKIFFGLDDAVMFEQTPRVWAQWRTTRRFDATARVVDCVVAGNSYLAKFFEPYEKRVIVLPPTVEPAHYQVKRHEATDAVRLVWIGSRSTLPYLREKMGAIELAAKRVAGLRLLIIADETLADAKVPVEFERWSEAKEAELLVHGDIGIAPTPCDRWTMGKCGFKIVQYMAAGLPVVASPVGANAEIVAPGVTGMLAESDEQWVEAIVKLAGNEQLRAKMGAAGRERVQREYSLDRAVETWAGLLG